MIFYDVKFQKIYETKLSMIL